MRFVKPVVGEWYLSRDTERMFEVVSVDDVSGAIELQDYDGILDEIDSEEWAALEVEAVEPPVDLDAAFDCFDADDVDRDADLSNLRFESKPYGLQAVWRAEALSPDSQLE
jgi:hypothetical protein